MDYKQTKAKLSMINNGEYVKIPLRITETHVTKSFFLHPIPPPNPSQWCGQRGALGQCTGAQETKARASIRTFVLHFETLHFCVL